jgi:lipid A 4'-phosphatase
MFSKGFIIFSLAVAVIFALFPELDIYISSLFFRDGEFYLSDRAFFVFMHDMLRPLIIVTVVVLIGVLIYSWRGGKIGRYLDKRAALFLLTYLLVGPAIVTNLIIKEHSGRDRPKNCKIFGGEEEFKPYYDFSGSCEYNCSFISGHTSGALFFLSLAYLFRSKRVFWAALIFGALMGITRVVQGSHFMSDVLFSFIINFIILKVLYYLFYREKGLW